MPTYDYKCEKCKHEFERQLPIAKMNEPTEYPCPCGPCHGTIIKMVAVPGFAYDNISSPGHKKSTPNWMKDKLKEIKRTTYKSTMNIPE